MAKKIFLIIDGHALIYRAFHAFPPSFVNKDGVLVNAVYGFAKVLLSGINTFHPEYIALTFDSKEQTNRQKEFAYYKSTRKPMPPELIPQIPLIKDFVEALSIPQFAIPGIEADDIIGSMSCLVNKDYGDEILSVIVTGDRDTFQLVNDNVHIYLPARGGGNPEEMDAASVKLKMGVNPDQIVDYKALAGDASDDIKGVPGVGAKTAVNLLLKFGNLDGVYRAILEEELKPGDKSEKYEILKGKLLERLIENKQLAYDSQKLAKIVCDESLDFDLESCVMADYDKQSVLDFLEKMGFMSLIKMLPKDSFENDLQDALF